MLLSALNLKKNTVRTWKNLDMGFSRDEAPTKDCTWVGGWERETESYAIYLKNQHTVCKLLQSEAMDCGS